MRCSTSISAISDVMEMLSNQRSSRIMTIVQIKP